MEDTNNPFYVDDLQRYIGKFAQKVFECTIEMSTIQSFNTKMCLFRITDIKIVDDDGEFDNFRKKLLDELRKRAPNIKENIPSYINSSQYMSLDTVHRQSIRDMIRVITSYNHQSHEVQDTQDVIGMRPTKLTRIKCKISSKKQLSKQIKF